MDRDPKFADFLQKFSNAYSGIERKRLRFLLFDHLTIDILSKKSASGMAYFNALETNGTISSTNVNILSEIAELTNNSNAKTYVDEYKQTFSAYSGKGKPLSVFRKDLYNCLEKFSKDASGDESTDVDKLIETYGLGSFGLQNKWDIIFHLEKAEKLDPHEKPDMKKFIDSLSEGPAKALNAYYPPKGQTDDSKAAASAVQGKALVNHQGKVPGRPTGTTAEKPTSTVSGLQRI